MINAGHIERASESEPSDYEIVLASMSLWTDVGHLPMKSYIKIMHAICNRRLCLKKTWIHYCTLWLSSDSSQTADRPRPTTTDFQ